MEIAWILFRVTDKPAFNLLVEDRHEEIRKQYEVQDDG